MKDSFDIPEWGEHDRMHTMMVYLGLIRVFGQYNLIRYQGVNSKYDLLIDS